MLQTYDKARCLPTDEQASENRRLVVASDPSLFVLLRLVMVPYVLAVETIASEDFFIERRAATVATQYQRDRQRLFSLLADFADAYYWAQKGDDSKMTAYVAARDKVKSDNPKP